MLNITHKIVFLFFCEFYITYYLFYTRKNSYSLLEKVTLSIVCFFIFNFCFNVLDWFLLNWSSSENSFTLFKSNQVDTSNIPYFESKQRKLFEHTSTIPPKQSINPNSSFFNFDQTKKEEQDKKSLIVPPKQNHWIPHTEPQPQRHVPQQSSNYFHSQMIPSASLDYEPSAPLLSSSSVTPTASINSSTPQTEMDELDELIHQKLKLHRIKVAQDGDCLFRALKEDYESVFDIRSQIVNFILENRNAMFGDWTKGMTLGNFITADYKNYDLDEILQRKLGHSIDAEDEDEDDLSSQRELFYWGNYTDIVVFVLMRHCTVELYLANALWEHEMLGNTQSQYRIITTPPNFSTSVKRILYISDNHYDKLVPL